MSTKLFQCDKCKRKELPINEIRVYHLTLRRKNLTSAIDQVVLCLSCDRKRRTTVTRYVGDIA